MPVYWEDTLDKPLLTFKSAAEIAQLYRDKGILPADEVITYCQVGMRASHDLFTLALIGHDLAQAPQLLRRMGGVGEPGGHAHQDEALMACPPGLSIDD